MIIRAWPWILLAVITGMFVSGCALSVNPIIAESDATFDPRLIGHWKAADGPEWVNVVRADGNTYAIEYFDRDLTMGRFAARLGRVSGSLILDIWPSPKEHDVPDPYGSVTIAGHLFFAIDIGADEFACAMLDPDSLLAALQNGQLPLQYRQAEEEFTLESATEQLRTVLGPYFARPGALPKRDVWRRAHRTAAGPPFRVGIPCYEASSWREADRLFLRDPHWVGSDGASSVDLGGGRILWLFGDTWVDPSGRHTRKGATMVSNTLAIQSGTDPSRSSITFYWGPVVKGKPTAFIADSGRVRHWFGNGIRVGDRLVLFLSRVISVSTGIGFESVGWTAWMVENPDAEPGEWRMHRLQTPVNLLGVQTGCAAVYRSGGHIYAFGSEDPVKSHPIYAVRWKEGDVRQGELMHPEWWGGEVFGWVAEASGTARYPIFEDGQSDLTIHFDEVSQRFVCVQTDAFGPADIMMRAAPALTGPWSSSKLVYRPGEYHKPGITTYSAKAHPELTGADLVVTYATNTFAILEQFRDSTSYYPHFVRLMRCR
jgi:hypothetical protein